MQILQHNYETHKLKTWPEFYKDVVLGIKTFELRKLDRDYQVGDVLRLEEWNPETHDYTGRYTEKVITHILKGACFGLSKGFGILSLGADGYIAAFKENEEDEFTLI